MFEFKKEKPVADVFLGFKIQYKWPAVGWIEGEVVKRNVDRRMKVGSDILNFFVFYQHDDDTPSSAWRCHHCAGRSCSI